MWAGNSFFSFFSRVRTSEKRLSITHWYLWYRMWNMKTSYFDRSRSAGQERKPCTGSQVHVYRTITLEKRRRKQNCHTLKYMYSDTQTNSTHFVGHVDIPFFNGFLRVISTATLAVSHCTILYKRSTYNKLTVGHRVEYLQLEPLLSSIQQDLYAWWMARVTLCGWWLVQKVTHHQQKVVNEKLSWWVVLEVNNAKIPDNNLYEILKMRKTAISVEFKRTKKRIFCVSNTRHRRHCKIHIITGLRRRCTCTYTL